MHVHTTLTHGHSQTHSTVWLFLSIRSYIFVLNCLQPFILNKFSTPPFSLLTISQSFLFWISLKSSLNSSHSPPHCPVPFLFCTSLFILFSAVSYVSGAVFILLTAVDDEDDEEEEWWGRQRKQEFVFQVVMGQTDAWWRRENIKESCYTVSELSHSAAVATNTSTVIPSLSLSPSLSFSLPHSLAPPPIWLSPTIISLFSVIFAAFSPLSLFFFIHTHLHIQ